MESTPESWLTLTFDSLLSFRIKKHGGDFGGKIVEPEVGDGMREEDGFELEDVERSLRGCCSWPGKSSSEKNCLKQVIHI